MELSSVDTTVMDHWVTHTNICVLPNTQSLSHLAGRSSRKITLGTIGISNHLATLCLRRRIYTEEKAKVVASVSGTEYTVCMYSISCGASYFAPGWYEEKRMHMQSSYSSNRPGAIYVASGARNCINSVPQIKWRHLPLRLCRSFFHARCNSEWS